MRQPPTIITLFFGILFLLHPMIHTSEKPSAPSLSTTQKNIIVGLLTPEERAIAQEDFLAFQQRPEDEQRMVLTMKFDVHAYNMVPFIMVANEQGRQILNECPYNYLGRQKWLEQIALGTVNGKVFNENNFTRLLTSTLVDINKPFSIWRSTITWYSERGYQHATPFQLLMINYNGAGTRNERYERLLVPDPKNMTFEKLVDVCVQNGARISAKNAIGQNLIEVLAHWIATRIDLNLLPEPEFPHPIINRVYQEGTFKNSDMGIILNALLAAYTKHLSVEIFYEEIAENNWTKQSTREGKPLLELFSPERINQTRTPERYHNNAQCLFKELSPLLFWHITNLRMAPYAFTGNAVVQSIRDAKRQRVILELPEELVDDIIELTGNNVDVACALSVIERIRKGGKARKSTPPSTEHQEKP